MAVKFPLEMKDGVKVRNISELKENFDIEKVMGYFLDGKLKKWLDDRWYEEKSERISAISADEPNLAHVLCEIFEIEYKENEVNPEEIAEKNRRIAKLKQYTDNEEIIKNIDNVAFGQEELAELYDRGVDKIYLCEGEFVVPKSKVNLNYELVGNVSVTGLERKQAKEEVEEEDVCVREPLIIDGHYKYEDAKIYIDNKINCKGSLEFENCEIYCDFSRCIRAKIDDNYVLRIDEGMLSFKNCRLHITLEKNLCFIGGRSCKVSIKECEVNNPQNLIGDLYRGNVLIEDCEFSNVFYPISKSYMKELTLSRCRITGSRKEHSLSERELKSRVWFLFGQIDEGLVNECTFTNIPQGVFSLAKKVTIDKSAFDRCQAILYQVQNAVIRNSVFDECFNPFIDACRQPSEILNLFNCKFMNCLSEIKAGNLKAEECCWNNGFISIRIPRYSNSSNGIYLSKCKFENINADNLMGLINNNNLTLYISREEIKEINNQMRAFIDAGIKGEMNDCTFSNVVMQNQKYLISCENYMKISNCNFRECLVKKEILDKEERTVVDLCGGFLGIFNKEYKTKPTYSVANCVGIY